MIKPISSEATRPLRQRVLRPHQTVSELVYEGDDAPKSLHLGAFKGDELVGVMSIYQEPPPNSSDEGAWRLRGVATAPEVRGEGYGGALLEAAIVYVAEQGATLLWCNARANVLGYYEHYGFEWHGEQFDSPTLGLHYFISRVVTPEASPDAL